MQTFASYQGSSKCSELKSNFESYRSMTEEIVAFEKYIIAQNCYVCGILRVKFTTNR